MKVLIWLLKKQKLISGAFKTFTATTSLPVVGFEVNFGYVLYSYKTKKDQHCVIKGWWKQLKHILGKNFNLLKKWLDGGFTGTEKPEI